MAAMDELGTQLQSLQALKPPGVTPTKIKAITQLCVDNIQVCQSQGLCPQPLRALVIILRT